MSGNGLPMFIAPIIMQIARLRIPPDQKVEASMWLGVVDSLETGRICEIQPDRMTLASTAELI